MFGESGCSVRDESYRQGSTPGVPKASDSLRPTDAEFQNKFSWCGRLNALQRKEGMQLQSWRIKLPMW